VHFPVAFYVGALGLDVLSRVGRFPAAPLAATWLLIGAFAGTVFAVTTGLVDWWGMVPGSKKRRHRAEADPLWIVIEAVGVAVLIVAQWFGGVLVYGMGMRVSTAQHREQDGT